MHKGGPAGSALAPACTHGCRRCALDLRLLPSPPTCRSGCPWGLGFRLVLPTVAPNTYYYIAVSQRPTLGFSWNAGLRLLMRMERPLVPNRKDSSTPAA